MRLRSEKHSCYLGAILGGSAYPKTESPLSWPTRKPSSTARGLGQAHREERARLLPFAYGRLCPYYEIDPLCTGLMLHEQALELDHGKPRALGGVTGDGTGRIAHGPCNRRAGARLAVEIRRNKGQLPSRSSREL